MLLSGVKEYYEKQFATLESFEEVDSLCMAGEVDENQEHIESEEQKQSELAMKISNYANIILLAFKVQLNVLHFIRKECAQKAQYFLSLHIKLYMIF